MNDGTTPQLTADEEAALDAVGQMAFEHFGAVPPDILYRLTCKADGHPERIQ